MNSKEPINLYRAISVTVIVLATFALSAALGTCFHLYLDDVVCMIFIDFIFLSIFLFSLEHERLLGHIHRNTQSNFTHVTFMYVFSLILAFVFAFLPEFSAPVMILPLLLGTVTSELLSMCIGLYLNLLICLATGAGVEGMTAQLLLTLYAAMILGAARQKKLRLWLAFLTVFAEVTIYQVCYYLSYRQLTLPTILDSAAGGIVTAIVLLFAWDKLWNYFDDETSNIYLDIVSEDYSEVKALKYFSMTEYQHAKRVSDIAYRCARQIGCNEQLAMAAGFYYRMGEWLGEPLPDNIVKKTHRLCFPEELNQILLEYYGQRQLPSSPESALIHMIDSLVVKFDLMSSNMGASQWNRDMLILQTLNDYSASGLYDESGMSMNQFLKVREFLAKEEMLL